VKPRLSNASTPPDANELANLVRRTVSFSQDEHWHARVHPPFR
jgi:hypothetical protein